MLTKHLAVTVGSLQLHYPFYFLDETFRLGGALEWSVAA
jgi:hypothetical protein